MDGPLLITVAHGATMLGTAAMLTVVWRHDRRKVYALYWAGAFLLLGLGWILLTALRPENGVQAALFAAMADPPFPLGFLLFALGTARYFGRPLPVRPLVALAAAGSLGGVVAAASDAPLWRELMTSGASEPLILTALFMLARHGRRNVAETALLVSIAGMALMNGTYVALLFVESPGAAFDGGFSGFTVLMLTIPINTVAVGVSGALAVCLQLIGETETTLDKLRTTQKQLIESAKMASLGGLVAGVAHEINTPLGIALTCATHLSDLASRLAKQAAEGQMRRSDFERTMRGVTDSASLVTENLARAADLVQSFKQVAIDQTGQERRRFELRFYIDEVVASLHPAWAARGHRFDVRCPLGIQLDGYPGALAQVLGNLVSNSVLHGYEPERAGRLTLSVVELDAEMIELTYADDGRGIPAEHRDKVFDPFFTTKRGAGCTGLGLHIVFNLVSSTLGGRIELSSVEGRGTRVVLRLPKTAPAATPAADAPEFTRTDSATAALDAPETIDA